MKANEIIFGLEFETTLPQADDTPIGGYHHGAQVPWLSAGWTAEFDRSIQRTSTRKACEFVSPKLVGPEGVAQVEAALAAMKARGAEVNASCGLHITITWRGDAKALARLITLVANHETAIYAATGTHSRERGVAGRSYCKPVKGYATHAAAKRRCESDRFHILNLEHLAAGQPRIEFRAFAGSLNATKVVGYLMMVLGLAELALANTRCSSWSYEPKPGKPGPWARKDAGLGEVELNRLFFRLGWTKGHTKNGYRYGEVGTRAWTPIKAKLRKLAEKYDRE